MSIGKSTNAQSFSIIQYSVVVSELFNTRTLGPCHGEPWMSCDRVAYSLLKDWSLQLQLSIISSTAKVVAVLLGSNDFLKSGTLIRRMTSAYRILSEGGTIPNDFNSEWHLVKAYSNTPRLVREPFTDNSSFSRAKTSSSVFPTLIRISVATSSDFFTTSFSFMWASLICC
jgi:hypothetical protein